MLFRFLLRKPFEVCGTGHRDSQNLQQPLSVLIPRDANLPRNWFEAQQLLRELKARDDAPLDLRMPTALDVKRFSQSKLDFKGAWALHAGEYSADVEGTKFSVVVNIASREAYWQSPFEKAATVFVFS